MLIVRVIQGGPCIANSLSIFINDFIHAVAYEAVTGNWPVTCQTAGASIKGKGLFTFGSYCLYALTLVAWLIINLNR